MAETLLALGPFRKLLSCFVDQGTFVCSLVRETTLTHAYIVRIQEVDLPPDRPYIFGYHPHGIISQGAFANYATEGTGFSKAFPGIRPHLLTLSSSSFISHFLRRNLLVDADDPCPLLSFTQTSASPSTATSYSSSAWHPSLNAPAQTSSAKVPEKPSSSSSAERLSHCELIRTRQT